MVTMTAEKALSIVEKLNSANEKMGVSKSDIGMELKRLTETEDETGLKDLFEAYFNYEVRWCRSHSRTDSIDQIRARSLRNFDYVSRIQDVLLAGNPLEMAFDILAENRSLAGRVTKFFRKTLDYSPQINDPKLN